MTRKVESFILVIFGASGDLAKRKLFPTLYELARLKQFCCPYRIIGFGRSSYTQESFSKHIKKELTKNLNLDKENGSFFKNIEYFQGDYDSKKSFEQLKEKISPKGSCSNILFYLSIPPGVIGLILNNLNAVNLHGKSKNCLGWRRIIIEKPFGSDLKSAKQLNALIAKSFSENQIFRMDHYLAKETVQNLLVFRFANGLFEPIWNRNFIDFIKIDILENFGVRNRGAYYEKAGLIRDVIQNHALQLLAIIAMEPPASMNAEPIRDEKVKVFKSIRKMDAKELKSSVIIGQYEGYTQEKNVNPNSKVETFASIKLFIDNWRWKGIPFYIKAGKNLRENKTQITIQFKSPPHNLFGIKDNEIIPNKLIIDIQPDERIFLKFGAKRPGKIVLDQVSMTFDYKSSFREQRISAYHQLLMDIVTGDQTRYVRKDGVENCWKIIDTIRSYIGRIKPVIYKRKTHGP